MAIRRATQAGGQRQKSEPYQCAAELSASPGQLSDGGVGLRQQRLLQTGQQRIQPATLEQTHTQEVKQWFTDSVLITSELGEPPTFIYHVESW